MDKENYLKRKQVIVDTINAYKEDLIELNKSYIKSNSEYKIGQKVIVVTPPYKVFWSNKLTEHKEDIVYVSGYNVTFFGHVQIELKKSKKNGEMSQHNYRYNEDKSYITPCK
jgi:hypothetical protein